MEINFWTVALFFNLLRLIRFLTPDCRSILRSNLLTNKAQKTDVTIPIAKVIPKPLTGPVPSQIKIEAVMRVVRLASIIVENAFA